MPFRFRHWPRHQFRWRVDDLIGIFELLARPVAPRYRYGPRSVLSRAHHIVLTVSDDSHGSRIESLGRQGTANEDADRGKLVPIGVYGGADQGLIRRGETTLKGPGKRWSDEPCQGFGCGNGVVQEGQRMRYRRDDTLARVRDCPVEIKEQRNRWDGFIVGAANDCASATASGRAG